MKMFNKILDIINKLYPFKREKESERETNFHEYLKWGEEEKKEKVVTAIELCDEALDIVADRISLINRLKDADERMADVAAYGELTDDDVSDLKELLDRYTNMSRESNNLKYQVTSFDPGLGNLSKLEKQAAKAVPEIKFAEGRQRIFKHDIGHLEGEKVMLAHNRERLHNAVDFVFKFSIAMVLFFAVAAAVLVYLYIVQNIQTIVILSGMLIFVIVISGLLYWLRQRLKFELAINRKKQKRAVELLNKKVAVYAHFTNYLNHEYRKYKVRNAKMLETNLEDFNNYKHLTRRMDSLRDLMTQTEDAIELFLREKDIARNYGSIEKFAHTINIDDKMTFAKDLQKEKLLIETSLKRLDNRNKQIWDILAAMKAAGGSDAEIVAKIIDECEKKAGHLIEADEKFGTTAMLDEAAMELPLAEEM